MGCTQFTACSLCLGSKHSRPQCILEQSDFRSIQMSPSLQCNLLHFICSTCSKSPLHLTARRHPHQLPPPHTHTTEEFTFSWRAITGQMPGCRGCFSSSSICLLGSSSGSFIGSTKMARGSGRAQQPTCSQVASQLLPGCLGNKEKTCLKPIFKFEGRPNPTLSP